MLWAHLLGEEPQWSRPMIGRTTDHDQRRAGAGDRAAMEPAVPRPDDLKLVVHP
jgi:hypothetical protein